MKNTKLWLNLLAVISSIGALGALILTKHFYDIHSQTNEAFRSFCNLGSKMNCDVITSSRYAELFFGLPLSSFVVGWLLASALIALVSKNPLWRRDGIRALFVMFGFSLVMSLHQFFIMAFILKTFCLLCLSVDAIVIGGFVITLLLKPDPIRPHAPDRKKWQSFAILTGLTLMISVLGCKAALDQQSNSSSSDVNALIQEIMAQRPVAIPVSTGTATLGDPQAPITITEYSDFQCPYCSRGALVMNTLLNRFPGKIKVNFRNFPLDPTCNRKLQHALHAAACESAKISICANKLGVFEPVYEFLFEHQKQLQSGKVLELLQASGTLNDTQAKEITTCLNSPETAQILDKDITDADVIGVQSTPTFFVEGRKIEGAYPLAFWEELFRELGLNK